MSLADRYGQLDGEINYNYAVRFARVGRALTTAQKSALAKLRFELIGNLNPTGAYLYAEPIPMPVIENTDFLFGTAPKGGDKRR